MEINRKIEQALDTIEARQGQGLRSLSTTVSRRSALKLCAGTIAGIASWQFYGPWAGADAPIVITEQAQGLVIADPTRCVACRRCELACTNFNDGKSSPAVSRIKVWRNINYGPTGLYSGDRTKGDWGSGLIVQDFCKQCPHPVPCADACPNGAIVARPSTGARAVDQERCTGCGVCTKACPWEMISLDPETKKAVKCFLCDGKPKCVEACPAEALMYVPWVDLTGKVPPRVSGTFVKHQACTDCHK
jgi:Fe-S-cluster-containing dehydrogenase component